MYNRNHLIVLSSGTVHSISERVCTASATFCLGFQEETVPKQIDDIFMLEAAVGFKLQTFYFKSRSPRIHSNQTFSEFLTCRKDSYFIEY